MFDNEELECVIALQQKSYNLLKWAGVSLKRGALSFAKVHSALGLQEAAREWIALHHAGIPPEARPAIEDLEPFSHIFVSFLTTSFELVETPGAERLSRVGCYCRYCSYLAAADHLKVRSPGKKARENAIAMKDLYLASVATDIGVSYTKLVRESVHDDPTIAYDISYAAYCRELIRRSQFASQGEGVLVLWREIAWHDCGKLKKRFALSADRALEAEAKIVARLQIGSPNTAATSVDGGVRGKIDAGKPSKRGQNCQNPHRRACPR